MSIGCRYRYAEDTVVCCSPQDTFSIVGQFVDGVRTESIILSNSVFAESVPYDNFHAFVLSGLCLHVVAYIHQFVLWLIIISGYFWLAITQDIYIIFL